MFLIINKIVKIFYKKNSLIKVFNFIKVYQIISRLELNKKKKLKFHLCFKLNKFFMFFVINF